MGRASRSAASGRRRGGGGAGRRAARRARGGGGGAGRRRGGRRRCRCGARRGGRRGGGRRTVRAACTRRRGSGRGPATGNTLRVGVDGAGQTTDVGVSAELFRAHTDEPVSAVEVAVEVRAPLPVPLLGTRHDADDDTGHGDGREAKRAAERRVHLGIALHEVPRRHKAHAHADEKSALQAFFLSIASTKRPT